MNDGKEEKGKIEGRIQDELAIDESRLVEELQRQSSRFFYWATLWARAARRARMAKIDANETEARECKKYRADMEINDPKTRVTEKMLNDYCAEHEEVKNAKIRWIEAEYLQDVLGVAKDAFWQRNQALVNMVRNRAEESLYDEKAMNEMQEELEKRRKGHSKRKERKSEDIKE